MSEDKFPLSKMVEVEWHDACGSAGWKDIAEYNNLVPMKCRTVGYLLKQSKKEITIALTQAVNHDLNQSICIPAAWVTKIRKLRY